MDKEKDMRQMLSGENVEVPESLLPENMKKRLLQLEQEGVFDSNKRIDRTKLRSDRGDTTGNGVGVRKKGHIFMPYIRAGVAVAAGLVICVLSGSVNGFIPNPVPLTATNGVDTKNTGGASGLSSENGYDGYHLAYESLHAIEKARNAKESQGLVRRILNEVFPTEKKITADTDVVVNYDTMPQEESQDAAEGAQYDSFADVQNSTSAGVANSVKKSESSKAFSDTNVRTQGVNEGDIVKTDGDYIYEYISGSDVCNIFQVDGATTKCVAKIREKDFGVSMRLTDMYVSGDRLILLADISGANAKQIKKIYEMAGADYSEFDEESWEGYSYYPYYKLDYGYNQVEDIATEEVDPEDSDEDKVKKRRIVNFALTYIFDISDREKPKLEHMTFQDGGYTNSRMVGDVLYLFSQRMVSMDNMKEDEPKTYIPQINGKCVEKGCVSVPEDVQTTNYSIVSSLNVQTGETIDEMSMLGGASEIYVSGSHIYMLDEDAVYDKNGRTVITKFEYDEGKITKKATGKVKGFVDDDYALDEYKGYLRLVSTYYQGMNYQERNAVYVLDEDLKVTGSIKNIAKNERIYSARFLGDTAYFVTYRQTDPLFTADLSDPKNPKIIGELKLPGFSDYLHPIGDHLLLGLGEHGDEEGDFEGLKLSLFDISDPVNVKEIHKEVLPEGYLGAEALENPNALFLDEERGLLGFYADGYGDYTYFVYSYDEKEGFKKKIAATLKAEDEYGYGNLAARGLYIDDFFYVVSMNLENHRNNEIISYDYRTFEHLKTNED
ncbi:MAG: beta-propeller domain-containing protein [Lachnospiraceae bacterium]|nr:beta-propeller domain-containing protein [Lachnospiraceae bacterium]